jgi:hypothetical protein
MKKILVLLLLTVSTTVSAEWTRVSGSPDGDMTVYVDYGTIKKKGNKVKMWNMYDFKTVQISVNKNLLSSVNRVEYDCEEETGRTLDFYWYSRNMRNGEIVFSLTNQKDEPESILPGSINEGLLKIACGKK